MENRYKKIVVEDKGGTFQFFTEEDQFFVISGIENGELRISIKSNCKTEKYMNPPIPEGYSHVLGEWYNGFVIERCSDKSQFVWIPVGYLYNDGTIDGNTFIEQFGRRNFMDEDFSEQGFNDFQCRELLEQIESVKKYGGFYISRFNISKSFDEKPQSAQGTIPWTNVSFFEAKRIASIMENGHNVKSHLTYGSEYDSVLAWFIKSGAKTLEEITKDSNSWGNYWNSKNSPQRQLRTGSRKKWCVNNIYDLAGNVDEWTQEVYQNYFVIRGGFYFSNGKINPVASRNACNPDNNYIDTGFRVSLYIK